MKHQLELDSVVKIERTEEPGPQIPTRVTSLESALPAVTVGRLVDIEPGPMVDFPMNHSGQVLLSRTLVQLEEGQVGSDVALVFEDGEVTRPIIVGVMQEWNARRPDRLRRVEQVAAVEVKHDNGSLLLTAAKEITLKCGKASITLTSAGKLLLRGAYLLSRSSGVNRIKGGSVQIN
jgi:hypothetical protein